MSEEPALREEDDLSTLFAFYERCGPEASGHSFGDRGWQNANLIERFIRGECTDEERRELARFLQDNPQFIRQIAERLKEARDAPPNPGDG